MKRILSCWVLFLLFVSAIMGQADKDKGIRILKLDAYNLVGIGLQQLHLGYEITPFEVNQSRLPTIQFDAYIPLSTFDGTLAIKPGIEAGIQLRFYQGGAISQTNPSGFFLGAGLDAGFTQFDRMQRYTLLDPLSNKDREISKNANYTRFRTGIYGMFGAQSSLGERMFFDVSFGLGWNNISVKKQTSNPEGYDPNDRYSDLDFFGRTFRVGKYPALYVPLNMSIGFKL
jgi:hypothetical protein